jgi:hypothetical protein
LLKTADIWPLWKDNVSLCECGIGTAAFSFAFAQTINPQVHWGNRCFHPKELTRLMHDVGLSNVQFFPFPVGLARLTSMACIGFRTTHEALPKSEYRNV